MEDIKENNLVQIKEKESTKDELRVFQKCFLLFLIAQVLLTISTLGYATTINGVPRFLSLFKILSDVSNVIFIIALFKLKRINISFRHSFYSIITYLITIFVYGAFISSTNQFYVALGYGIKWTNDILSCMFYLYFFHGCYIFFNKNGLKTGRKRALITFFVFLTLFILKIIFVYITSVKLVLTNTILNRFFVYGSWALTASIYIFIFVMVLQAAIYVNKKLKPKTDMNSKKGEKKHE